MLGQLFEVTAADLAAMDRLERVHDADGYRRVRIAVEPEDGGPGVEAFVYVQQTARLQRTQAIIGPLAEYTAEHARHLDW